MVDDPYVYPGTDVLRNRLGIREAVDLAEREAVLSVIRIAQLERRFIPGGHNLTHLRATHLYIFGDVYPWAGELRTVRIAKDGDLFALPEHIGPYLTMLFADLAHENLLRGLGREQFVKRLTHYYAEINAVHPFREGNGRAQRALLGQIAKAAGYPIVWARLDPERNIHTARESHRGNNSPLHKMLSDLLETTPAPRALWEAPLPALQGANPLRKRAVSVVRAPRSNVGVGREPARELQLTAY